MPADAASPGQWLVVGRLKAVFGVKGWLKLESFTEPAQNILSYRPWRLNLQPGQGNKPAAAGPLPREVVLEQVEQRGKDIVVKFEGLDDRESAAVLSGLVVEVPQAVLPAAGEGEYYWHELEGLEVFLSDDQGSAGESLGRIDHMMETGANDVIVVRGNGQEWLLPYLPGSVVLEVDLAAGRMVVDWDTQESG